MPPELVGVGAKLSREKEKEKERAKEEERRKEQQKQQIQPVELKSEEPEETAPVQVPEDDVVLPPLRPVGTPP